MMTMTMEGVVFKLPSFRILNPNKSPNFTSSSTTRLRFRANSSSASSSSSLAVNERDVDPKFEFVSSLGHATRPDFPILHQEHEPWCKRYMELYQELRENWERLYWDEGYSKKLGQDHANCDSAEDDDQDFSPYRKRLPHADQMKGKKVKVPTFMIPATQKVWMDVYSLPVPRYGGKTCSQIFEEADCDKMVFIVSFLHSTLQI